VSGAPAGSDRNNNDWQRDHLAFDEGAVVVTDDTVYAGFGVEGLAPAQERCEVERAGQQRHEKRSCGLAYVLVVDGEHVDVEQRSGASARLGSAIVELLLDEVGDALADRAPLAGPHGNLRSPAPVGRLCWALTEDALDG
jgi:hypothetical protein